MPVSAPSSASSSPSANSVPTTSAGFSSTPINPVMVHSGRHKSDGWHKGSDSQNQNSANSGGYSSRSSSGTPDEDIRFKTQTQDDAQKQNHTLPSLSSGGTALLHLRDNSTSNNPSSSMDTSNERLNSTSDTDSAGNKLPPQSSANAQSGANTPVPSFSRSGSREEGNPLIPDEEMDEEMDEEDDVEEDDSSTPPSPTDREIRINFHGREIFAEDLIGLRVAKTFAGHGRFLGQVVKFDKRVALYTVVYADGDVEDLTVDATLQILIQDEIERADPAQPPALLFKKAEDGTSPASPDMGEFMAQPLRQAPPTRTCIQISEREAQFVISLFENHALPTLVRQGWRVQSSSSGTRFLSPVGEIFSSALDVVCYIASDNQLLIACFPANVHAAILSLLPSEAQLGVAETSSNHGSTGSASRKRTTSDSPAAQQFDGKRTRPTREEAYALSVRAGVARSTDTALYRSEDLDRRAEAASRMAAYHIQAVGGRIRVSGDRFVAGERTGESGIQTPPNGRRESNRDPTLENPFTSRWPGRGPATGRINAEYARHFAGSPGWRERGESDRPLDLHSRNRIRAEGRYINRMSARNPTDIVDGGVGGATSGCRNGYYRESAASSPGSQTSPMTNSTAYPQYRPRAGDYRSSEMAARITAVPRVSREATSFLSPTDTHGTSAAFSMVDVDRISNSRPGSAHLDQQPRTQSPHQGDGQPTYLQHHRRTDSSQSFQRQRGSEGRFGAEPTSEAQGEQPTSAASNMSVAPSQQHE